MGSEETVYTQLGGRKWEKQGGRIIFTEKLCLRLVLEK